ncbi:zinc-ribbon domain-containing protein [Hespellia stercorisuis]|uniref:Zinc-ribbon domain-containing protein n=1 Tax=Hespellia stercorisuis DSM 15480 TaxID=1121950 RepID=A0A1M6NUW9_9FIRM|nr:zinc-ribbon domain-containing protein [Hespellia stercorisuis]SHJ99404.1 zinc-ribbon domain-containing protein [Hespellia stercorisuis DSM 15480]
MFCANCGKEVEKEWKVCPNCGKMLNESATFEGRINKEMQPDERASDSDEDIKLLKAMWKEHPVRFVLCVPILLYIIYRLFNVLTTDFSVILPEIFRFYGEGSICSLGLWLAYGPNNYKELENDVKGTQRKHSAGIIIIANIVVALIVWNVFFSSSNEEAENKGPSTEVSQTASKENDTEQIADMTIEEYVDSCVSVTADDLARNPEAYIGENIIMEGIFSIVFDDIFIGLWEGQGGLEVSYKEKNVYNANGEVIGNVISGDYGYAAGVFRGDNNFGNPYMDGVLIIVTEER